MTPPAHVVYCPTHEDLFSVRSADTSTCHMCGTPLVRYVRVDLSPLTAEDARRWEGSE